MDNQSTAANLIFVKPVGDAVVINPATNRRIPTEGELVTEDKYIRRRINDGDLVQASMSDALTSAKGKKSAQ